MKSFLFRFRFSKTNRFSFYKTKRNYFRFYFRFRNENRFDVCYVNGKEKPRHGETRLAGANEIAVITSHNRRTSQNDCGRKDYSRLTFPVKLII